MLKYLMGVTSKTSEARGIDQRRAELVHRGEVVVELNPESQVETKHRGRYVAVRPFIDQRSAGNERDPEAKPVASVEPNR